MATSRKSVKKRAPVTQFPEPTTSVAVEDVPESFQEPPETQPAPAPPPPQNPLKKKAPSIPPEGDFFTRVAAIPRGEWDTGRIYLYLYILEPLCNLKQSGGKAYLNRYSEPVRDEHQIAVEYGSGRYRLMLAYNKVSPLESTEVARYEFEIYNPQYPPKVPRAAWINDARNVKWEALLPKETPPQPANAASTIVDAMKMVSDIRRDVREEMEPTPPTDTQSPSEMVQTFKAMKDILTPATAAAVPAKDPIELATALATTMMQMKADNPIVDILRDELKAMREEAAKGREREFDLQKQVLEAKSAPSKDGDWFDRLIALTEKAEKIEGIKKVFGLFTGNGGGEVVRAGRTTAYDMMMGIASSPFGANLGQGLGMVLTNLSTMRQPAPVMTNGAPAPQTHVPPVLNAQQPNGTIPPKESDEQRIQRIGQLVTQPMLYEFFLKDAAGDVFAERMFDMWPEDYIFLRNLGPENLVNRYRQFAPAWAIIGPKEPQFIEFIQEFCKWDPNEDEGPLPDDPAGAGVTDLEDGA